MDDVIIRPALSRDLPALADLATRTWSDAFGDGVLGRRLMEAALRHPQLVQAKRIVLQVWEKNERAVRLYESFGFQRIGTTTFKIGAEVMEDLVMLLDKTEATG